MLGNKQLFPQTPGPKDFNVFIILDEAKQTKKTLAASACRVLNFFLVSKIPHNGKVNFERGAIKAGPRAYGLWFLRRLKADHRL